MKDLYASQLNIIKKIRKSIENNGRCAIDSPTGTGKTRALLFSLAPHIDNTYKEIDQIANFLKDFEKEKICNESSEVDLNIFEDYREESKIYYVSRTHSQLNQVVEELEGLNIKTNCVVLGSRKVYCMLFDGNIEELNDNCTKENCSLKNKSNNLSEVKQLFLQEKIRKKVLKEEMDEDFEIKDTKKFIFSSKKLSELSTDNLSLKKINLGQNDDDSPNTEENRKEALKNIKFCPYYFSNKFSIQSDIVMLTYKNILSKSLREKNNIVLRNSIVIFDEAHNLYDLVTSSNTIDISFYTLKKLFKVINLYSSEAKKEIIAETAIVLSRIVDFFGNFLCKKNKNKINCKYHKTSNILVESSISVSEFLLKSDLFNINTLNLLQSISENNFFHKLGIKNLEYFPFMEFLRLLTESDKNGRIYVSYSSKCDCEDKNGNYKCPITVKNIKLTPLDPSIYLSDFQSCKSMILIGGTMQPIDLIKNLIKNLDFFAVETQIKNFKCYNITKYGDISLEFKHSTKMSMIQHYTKIIKKIAETTKGGTVVFVSSKENMRLFQNVFNTNNCFYDDFEGYKNYLDDHFENSEDFLCDLSSEEIENNNISKKGKLADINPNPVLFSVLNGKLSEGINFSDDLCRSLIIVGIPFPSTSLEIIERNEFISEKLKNNYSLLNAFNSVNQAIGRALRHKDDWANIYLLDKRYQQHKELIIPWVKEKMVSLNFDKIFK